MDRREFLKGALAGVGVAMGAGSLFAAQDAKKGAVLRLSSQEGPLPGKGLREKVEVLAKCGGEGIEIMGNPKSRVKEIQEARAGTKIRVSAVCWGSDKGKTVSTDPETRKKGIETLKGILETAGELGAVGVIYVPCFNRETKLSSEELDKVCADILPELADHAVKHKTNLILEPLNKGETFYLNTVAQVARLCKQINKPGCVLMGDFYHIGKAVEGGLAKSDQEEFVAGGELMRHVHLATTKKRILPGLEERSFVDGFTGLKKIGYQGFCSLECQIPREFKADQEIPKAFDLLRKQWDEAKP